MKVSFQALARHLDLAGVTAERVAEVLPMLGLEVESVTTFGLAPLPLVVVGEITSFVPHPKADRLSVCVVDVGDGARARSSAVPRTSKPATVSRSRCRARGCPAVSRSRSRNSATSTRRA
ncbi:phenylalanine--tRNA ligase beta subunit, partial [Verrucomicrobiota bacterium]